MLQTIEKWRAASPHTIHMRLCMGGMLAGWPHYRDDMRAVSKPVQMGPVWLEAKQMTGISLDDRIWFLDPPASSYPACLAVKAAALQSPEAAELYLKAVQQAIMTGGKNIAKKEVLLSVAADLATTHPEFDAVLFKERLQSKAAIAAFKADLAEVDSARITRFPSLVLSRNGVSRKLLLTGYRPLEALEASVEQLLADT